MEATGAATPAESAHRPASAAALELRGVTRSHGGRPVWAALDLTVLPGTLCVVTGANGSGKSTLLRLAAGLLRPTSGSRHCAGRSLYVRGGAGLRSAQTVADAVRSTAALVDRSRHTEAALALAGLGELARRRVGTLSAGERVRAALAAALAVGPTVLCLDEPTAALDDRALHDLVDVLAAARAEGTAVLVATHQPAVLLPAADAHLQIRDGRVVTA